MLWFAVLICAVALLFDFLNGFHDAANSIATVVSTRVLSPRVAVVWAAFFNFVAAFTFGTAVAKTMGKGMIRLDAVNLYVILAGLALIGIVVGKWAANGFGTLREERLAIFAATVIAVGAQIFFTSFLLSIIGIRRPRDEP